MSQLGRFSRSGQLANAAERAFARACDEQGKTWLFQPKQFELPSPHRSYRPDFYVIEDGCFYEIVGTRQAYSFRREQIEAFRSVYPQYRLVVVNNGAWQNGPTGPRRDHVQPAHKPLKRSTKEKLRQMRRGSTGEAIAALMQSHGIETFSELARKTGVNYWKLMDPPKRDPTRLLDELRAGFVLLPA